MCSITKATICFKYEQNILQNEAKMTNNEIPGLPKSMGVASEVSDCPSQKYNEPGIQKNQV